MLYAIDSINSRENYLNFSLGALIFDTCENPDNAFMQSLRFIVVSWFTLLIFVAIYKSLKKLLE